MDKVCTSETMMVARHCHAQPLSFAVSRGNYSYNTNCPSASMVTIVRNHSHTYACAAFPSLLFKGGVYFVQELQIMWLLFEGGIYSKKYGNKIPSNLHTS